MKVMEHLYVYLWDDPRENNCNSIFIDGKTPLLVVANKIDLKRADIDRIRAAFPEHDLLGISAKNGDNIDRLYEALFALTARAIQ